MQHTLLHALAFLLFTLTIPGAAWCIVLCALAFLLFTGLMQQTHTLLYTLAFLLFTFTIPGAAWCDKCGTSPAGPGLCPHSLWISSGRVWVRPLQCLARSLVVLGGLSLYVKMCVHRCMHRSSLCVCDDDDNDDYGVCVYVCVWWCVFRPEPYSYRYIRCLYGIFGREITIHTVIYGADIRFWPTLNMT